MDNPLFEQWQNTELELTDIDGNKVTLLYGQVKRFQQYQELGTTSFHGAIMANGSLKSVIHFETDLGKLKIPRMAENDTAILDFMMTRPNP